MRQKFQFFEIFDLAFEVKIIFKILIFGPLRVQINFRPFLWFCLIFTEAKHFRGPKNEPKIGIYFYLIFEGFLLIFTGASQFDLSFFIFTGASHFGPGQGQFWSFLGVLGTFWLKPYDESALNGWFFRKNRTLKVRFLREKLGSKNGLIFSEVGHF